jgi:hypothetical protein
MAKFVLILALFSPFITFSQDLIILRNGEHIECKITKVDSSTVYYDFVKGERKLSSFIDKRHIHSFKVDSGYITDNLLAQEHTVIIDTTEYIRETSQWINLITFSNRNGVHAKGWSIQYIGYNLKNTSNWSIPLFIGLERFQIYPDYFSQFNYYSAEMSYFLAGINPFYRINDYLFINLGINLIIGEEKLTRFYGQENSRTFFGITTSQGIYLVPGSEVGITVGIGIYERILNSEVYKNDLGLNLEIGIKF